MERQATDAGESLSRLLLLRQDTQLLHEGEHVKVVPTILNLPTVEVQHPTCTRRLLFPGWRHYTARTL